MDAAAAMYPVTLEVDYPERQSRWKTLLRLFLAIPVLVFAALLLIASYAIAIATWIAIVVRGRIPGWMFDFQVRLVDWQVRAFSYTLLLTDTYPAFEGPYPTRFDAEYPKRLSRWKVLIWKYVTAVPHFIVLEFLWIGAFLAVIAAWLCILITGRFPKGLHGYIVGVGRWQLRVQAYALSLTDEFPPFSLSGNAGTAGKDTYVISSIIGSLLFLAGTGGAVIAATYQPPAERLDVSYAALLSEHATATTTPDIYDVHLTHAIDPADASFPYLAARYGNRLIAFDFEFESFVEYDVTVHTSDFRLKDAAGKSQKPLLVIVGGHPAAVTIEPGHSAEIIAIFEVGEPGQPKELRYYRADYRPPAAWQFR